MDNLLIPPKIQPAQNQGIHPLRVGNLDPSIKAMQAARMAAGRFFQVGVGRGTPRGTPGGVKRWWEVMTSHDFIVVFPTKNPPFFSRETFILEKNVYGI